MKKFFLLLILVLLSGCLEGKPEVGSDNPALVPLDFRVEKVTLIDNRSSDGEAYLEFETYLERPDLGLTQPENHGDLLTEDLPDFLRPNNLYVLGINGRDFESAVICESSNFPHRCSVNLLPEYFGADIHSFLMKVEFEDGTFAEQELSLRAPEQLPSPEIIEPSSIPSQGDSLALKFKDVGADSYGISVNLCRAYENDGINPCLEGVDYILSNEEGAFVVQIDNEFHPLDITVQEGVVTATSNFSLFFEDSVEIFVEAMMETELENGALLFSRSSDLKLFTL